MLPFCIRHYIRNQCEGNICSRVAAVEPKASSKAEGLFQETSPKALVKSPEKRNTHRLI